MALAVCAMGQSGAENPVGGIIGRIVNFETGQPVADVEVTVAESGLATVSSAGGRFIFPQVSPGTLDLQLRKDGYRDASITGVQVVANEVTQVDFRLPRTDTNRPGRTVSPEDESTGDLFVLEELVVEAEVLEDSGFGLVLQRQEAIASLNSLSSFDMSRYGAGDAAEALFRVTGVSVTSEETVVVRGLNDRYTNTLLNGLRVPSPNPNSQAVELDLFPSGVLEAITTTKTFTPDQPGDTSGGSVLLKTKTFPDEAFIDVSAGVSWNSSATQDDYISYAQGEGKTVAAGVRDRPLPGDFNNLVPFYVTTKAPPIGRSVGIDLGTRFGRDGRFGTNVGFAYKYSTSLESGTSNDLGFDVGGLADLEDLSFQNDRATFIQSEENARISLFGTVGFEYGEDNSVSATGFVVKSGIDLAQLQVVTPDPDSTQGENEFGTRYHQHDLYYKERELSAVQLVGEHTFERLGGLRLNWAGSTARTDQDEPDFRTAYYVERDDGTGFKVFSGSGSAGTIDRIWRDIVEARDSLKADLELPIPFFGRDGASIRGGFALDQAEREFSEDQLVLLNNRFVGRSGSPLFLLDRLATPAAATEKFAFSQDNDLFVIDPSLVFRQVAQPFGQARQDILAGYGMVTIPLLKPLTITAGARWESTEIEAIGSGELGNVTSAQVYANNPGLFPASVEEAGSIDQDDWQPSVTAVVDVTSRITFRGSYSQTVARPSFRELGAYFTENFDTGDPIIGNQFLEMSQIENFDLRVEWFGEGVDMVSLSGFRKTIERPIEQVSTRLTVFEDSLTWQNNSNHGEVEGFEIEFRKNLGFLSERLQGITVGGNFTRIDAEVLISPAELEAKTRAYGDIEAVPTTRRLFDQPEWIVNLDVQVSMPRFGTDLTFAAYGISDVLTVAGSDLVLDQFAGSYFRYDLNVSQELPWDLTLQFGVENIGDATRRLIYNPEIAADLPDRRTYRLGRTYSVSLSHSF